MTFSFLRRLWPAILVGAMTALVAACGSSPTAAPVIERSPNPPAAKTAPAAVPASATASKPQTSAPPTPVPAIPPASVAPAVSTAKLEKLPPPVPEKLPAPLEEPTTKPYREGDWRPEYHIVRKGDTLYSIALDYGQDYRELAAWNNLEDPGLIKIDQRLRLFPQDSVGEATTAQPIPLAAPVAAPVFSEPKARKLPYSEQALAQLKMPAPKAAATPTPTPSRPATTQPSIKLPAAHTTPAPLPAPVVSGDEPLIVLGAIAGG